MRAHGLAGDVPAAGVLPRRLRHGPALWLGLALFAYAVRLLSGAASGASLHVDEAQYWDWSRHLQWGYFSKPPGIAALIALSRAAFGDSETGLRALALLCYSLTALVLALWAADAAAPPQPALEPAQNPAPRPAPDPAPDPAFAGRCGSWAAALFLASPIAGLLGLVATTDGPLLLCWALALAALWWAVVRQRAVAWAGFALACGAGLLAKQSFAALLPGAAAFVLLQRRGRDTGLLIAALGAAGLLWLPNLAWNQAAGWPTWHHTADITLNAAPVRSAAEALRSLAGFIAGQALILAPLLLPLGAWAGWRRRRPVRASAHRAVAAAPRRVQAPAPARPRPGPLQQLLLCTSLPLALLGAAQAWRGVAQINWITPVQLAVCMALAGRLAASDRRWQRLAAAALALQALLISLLVLAPGAAARSGWAWPPALDPWARMRGWSHAWGQLEPTLRAHPGALLLGTSRTLLAQAAYHGRALGLARGAWQGGAATPQPPQHHYALVCRWVPGSAAGRALLVLSEGPPPPLGDGSRLVPLLRVPVSDLRGPRFELWLSRREAPVAGLAPAVLPEPGADASRPMAQTEPALQQPIAPSFAPCR